MSSNNNRSLRTRASRTNRAVAESVGARFARPEQPSSNTRSSSAGTTTVSSTPFGNVSSVVLEQHDNNDEEWCGPFSVARQMINQREEAKRKLEERRAAEAGIASSGAYHHPLDQIVGEVEDELKQKGNPSFKWKLNDGNVDDKNNYYVKRRKRASVTTGSRVKSLFHLCRDFLVDNIDCVEALGDVDEGIRKSLCEELVSRNKMDDHSFRVVFYEEGIEALEIVDCASITQDELASALATLIPAGLQALMLNYCGRCFGSKAVDAIVSAYKKSTCNLFALSLGGAYLLSDADISRLISAISSSLTSIEFKSCHHFGPLSCNSIASSFDGSAISMSGLTELALEGIPLKRHDLITIASSNACKRLRNIRIGDVDAIDDEIMEYILKACGGSLEGVSLSHTVKVSDVLLSSIRRYNTNGSLRALLLTGLVKLSSAGLEALFTPDIEGLPPPPALRKLGLSELKPGVVTDGVISLAAGASAVKLGTSSSDSISAGVSNLGGLVHLNVKGASCTDTSMEKLAETCYSSLEELDLSFCPHVKDEGLGYLVSKLSHQFRKLHIWGCAQITDNFLDGHDRAKSGDLEITGAWMKKSGYRSMR